MGLKCGFTKCLAGLPSLLAAALITYISVVFLFLFMPTRYHDEWTSQRVAITLVFCVFSAGTFTHLFRTLVSDPGYLKDHWRHSPLSNGLAPLTEMRLHNLRLFQANNLYDFNGPADEESALLEGTELRTIRSRMP